MEKKHINPNDFKKPVFGAIIVSTIVFFCLMFLAEEKARPIIESFFDLSINFGLTYIAFTITVFALLQLLHAFDWFKDLVNTNSFNKFINNFEIEIFLNIGIFISSILCKFLGSFILINWLKGLATVLVFLIIFSVFWLWEIIKTMIKLYKIGTGN